MPSLRARRLEKPSRSARSGERDREIVTGEIPDHSGRSVGAPISVGSARRPLHARADDRYDETIQSSPDRGHGRRVLPRRQMSPTDTWCRLIAAVADGCAARSSVISAVGYCEDGWSRSGLAEHARIDQAVPWSISTTGSSTSTTRRSIATGFTEVGDRCAATLTDLVVAATPVAESLVRRDAAVVGPARRSHSRSSSRTETRLYRCRDVTTRYAELDLTVEAAEYARCLDGVRAKRRGPQCGHGSSDASGSSPEGWQRAWVATRQLPGRRVRDAVESLRRAQCHVELWSGSIRYE